MSVSSIRFPVIRTLIGLVAFSWLSVGAALASDLRPFTSKSLEEIRRTHAGRPFILAFWSVSCEPCKGELSIIETLHRKFPEMPIVLVATDLLALKPAVKRFLADYELGRIETWQFSEFATKVRYSVDRAWRGELPRTYFFNAAHEVTPRSGVLDAQEVEAWLERESREQEK